jgi:hypothetical protein
MSTVFEIQEDGAGLWSLCCIGNAIQTSLRLEQAIRLASRYAFQCSRSCVEPAMVVLALPAARITLASFGDELPGWRAA